MERSPFYSFEQEWIGKRVDVDNFPLSWPYQCIDLAKQYCKEVLWIPYWKTGSARQMWNNEYKFFDANRTQIVWAKDLMQGDIVFFDFGPDWHVAIMHNIIFNNPQVLEQNWGWKNSWSWIWSNAIRLHTYNPTSVLWVWRCQKIFDNLQKERTYCDDQIKNTQDYKTSIRYQG